MREAVETAPVVIQVGNRMEDATINADKKVRVLLAGGRKLFREGVCALLERDHEMRVIAEAQEAQDAPRLLQALPAQVVVLSLSPIPSGGPDLVRQILDAQPQAKVIVLCGSQAIENGRELEDAGASACLTKECAADELALVIRRVINGKGYFRSMAGQRSPVALPHPMGPSQRRSLAPREREILGLSATGYTTKEIARLLDVSTKTVETHRRRLMEKLNCHSVAQLTKYAVVQGLATLETSI
jgi:DNA-binding NarL/FixJ family response regulator